jgi:predicted nucleotidyltransferase component of viral defense system
MSPTKPQNVAASVRQKLTNLSKKRGEEFQFILSEYAIERLLYRISRSKHSARFVLKGAKLFSLWADQPHRATWDLDLLSKGESSVRKLRQTFQEICETAVADDGLIFDTDSIRGDEIRADEEYQGIRLRMIARLARAQIPVQVDIGFGDVVTPAATLQVYPTLLDFPPPEILTYSRETVIAEKLEAMLSLGAINSRMKDFFDLRELARIFEFNGKDLTRAVKETFRRRRTQIPKETPMALTEDFIDQPGRQAQWKAFLRKGRLSHETDTLDVVIPKLREFLEPVLAAAVENKELDAIWKPGGPWQSSRKAK